MDHWPSVIDVNKQFGTTEACLDYFVAMRWPEGVRCPICDGDKTSKFVTNETTRKRKNGKGEVKTVRVPARHLYTCREPTCKYQFSRDDVPKIRNVLVFAVVAMLVDSSNKISFASASASFCQNITVIISVVKSIGAGVDAENVLPFPVMPSPLLPVVHIDPEERVSVFVPTVESSATEVPDPSLNCHQTISGGSITAIDTVISEERLPKESSTLNLNESLPAYEAVGW